MVRFARPALCRGLSLASLLAGSLAASLAAGLPAAAAPPPANPPATAPPSGPPSLDQLYARLATAGSDEEAKGITGAIERARLHSGSDTVDLLMSRALAATNGGDVKLGIRLLSAVISLRPAFTEAWNKRATLYYMRDDYRSAMLDIAETLKRDPKHFGAWSGLGMILQETGDKRHAYDAYKRALAIDPHLDAARKAVDDLRQDVEGQDI